MPMAWVPPALFTRVRVGKKWIKVWHCYKDDLNNMTEYWFTTNESQDDVEGLYDDPIYQFDVRDIQSNILKINPNRIMVENFIKKVKTWNGNVKIKKAIIRFGIKNGLIEYPEHQ